MSLLTINQSGAFFGYVMTIEKVEEEKHSRGKQQEKMLDGLTKWLNVGHVTDAPKATKD